MAHIKKLPTENQTTIDATVTEMNLDYAEYWDYHYQPTINNSGRADKNWSWPQIYEWFQPFAKLLRQKPFSYCIGVHGGNGEFVPVGMLMLVGKYPALYDHSKDSVFAWYLASIPDELVENHVGQIAPKALGRALMDVVLTHSFLCGLSGISGLHAAPSGGDPLFSFYQRLGMTNLPVNVLLPGLRRFRNDGRYFYTDQAKASEIRSGFDIYR